MHSDDQIRNTQNTLTNRLKRRFHDLIERAKKLRGDPHYIAVGMAIGVFVAITPTIPFHTAIALALAFILRGSKPAAVIAVWVSNPVTIPFFYLGSYKVGNFILGNSIPFDPKYESLAELAKLGLNATIALMVGGVILGIVPGIAAYFITRKIFTTLRARKAQRDAADQSP
ncbi:MAG: DUF2062 domain-containing protein [Thermodesulfobacteriota bacterium]